MRIRTLLTTAGLATATLAATALPASAAGTVCYDLHVQLNGDHTVDEGACEDLPL